MPRTPTLCPDASLESPGQGRASSPSSLVRPSSEAHVQSGPAKPAPKAETRSERPPHAGTRASTASADTDVTAVPRGRAATLWIRGSLHACPPGQSSRVDGGLCTEALPGKETQSRLCRGSEEAARTSMALRPAPVPCAPETFSASPSPRPAPGGGWWAWPTAARREAGAGTGRAVGWAVGRPLLPRMESPPLNLQEGSCPAPVFRPSGRGREQHPPGPGPGWHAAAWHCPCLLTPCTRPLSKRHSMSQPACPAAVSSGPRHARLCERLLPHFFTPRRPSFRENRLGEPVHVCSPRRLVTSPAQHSRHRPGSAPPAG